MSVNFFCVKMFFLYLREKFFYKVSQRAAKTFEITYYCGGFFGLKMRKNRCSFFLFLERGRCPKAHQNTLLTQPFILPSR